MSAGAPAGAEMQAVVLAGGLGTRLRPAVDDRPKAMAPVAGRPFLEYVVARLRRGGVTDLVFAVGYLAGAIRDYFGDGTAFGVRIAYSEETEPLGTGGALRLARPLLRDAFFVLNGDTFVDLDYAAMAAAHEAARARGTVALRRSDDAARYGSITLNEDGRVSGFREKVGGGGLINAGVYLFEKNVLDLMPPDGAPSLENNVLPKLAEQGELTGFATGGYFIDIGLPETLRAFEEDIRAGRVEI